MNTKLLAQLIRAEVATPPIGECVTGCGAESLPNYPACAFHAATIHFTHRDRCEIKCLCNGCCAADVRMVEGDAGVMADLREERIAA